MATSLNFNLTALSSAVDDTKRVSTSRRKLFDSAAPDALDATYNQWCLKGELGCVGLMLNTTRLRILREVAARGSLTGAAEALSFSQPAISNQIAKLEQETGTRLIERGPRGVRLTGAGELLVRHADSILSRLELAEAELEEHLHVRRGRLRLGAFPSAFIDLVSRSLASFRIAHPGVEVCLSEVSLEDAVKQLDDGELDLAVVFEYKLASVTFDEHPRKHLLDDPMYVVMPGDHPLRDRPKLRLADLRDEPWLEYTSGGPAAMQLRRAFSKAGFEPRVVLRIEDLLAIQGLVAAGVGSTLVPRMALPSLRPGLRVRTLGVSLPTRQVSALWPVSGLSPSAKAMLELLSSEAQRLQAELDELNAGLTHVPALTGPSAGVTGSD